MSYRLDFIEIVVNAILLDPSLLGDSMDLLAILLQKMTKDPQIAVRSYAIQGGAKLFDYYSPWNSRGLSSSSADLVATIPACILELHNGNRAAVESAIVAMVTTSDDPERNAEILVMLYSSLKGKSERAFTKMLTEFKCAYIWTYQLLIAAINDDLDDVKYRAILNLSSAFDDQQFATEQLTAICNMRQLISDANQVVQPDETHPANVLGILRDQVTSEPVQQVLIELRTKVAPFVDDGILTVLLAGLKQLVQPEENPICDFDAWRVPIIYREVAELFSLLLETYAGDVSPAIIASFNYVSRLATEQARFVE